MNSQNRHDFRDVWASAERSGYMPAAVPRRIHHESRPSTVRRLTTLSGIAVLLWVADYLWQSYAG